MCFACRGNIPVLQSIRPSYSLRDGSILYFSLLRGQRNLEVHGEMGQGKVTSTIPAPLTPAHQIHAQGVIVPDPLSYTETSNTLEREYVESYRAEQRRQIEADEEFARRLQLEINSAYHPVATSQVSTTGQRTTSSTYSDSNRRKFHCPHEGCETTCKSEAKLDKHKTICCKRPPREIGRRFDRVAVPDPALLQLYSSQERRIAPGVPKMCGHMCCPSSVQQCCRCADKRQMQPEGTYPEYVDGMGWCNKGNRDAGYCPACKSS